MVIAPELIWGRELMGHIGTALRRGQLDVEALLPASEALDVEGSASGSQGARSSVLAPDFYRSRACYLVPRLPESALPTGSWCGLPTGAGPEQQFYVEVPRAWPALVHAALSLVARYRHDAPEEGTWPLVFVAAEFAASSQQTCAQETAGKMATALAEMGLWGRPLHVWLGESVVLDCLSPYCRELREVLTRWASAHPDSVGADLSPITEPVAEHVLYAVAHDFCLTDPALAAERATANRTVGISSHGVSGTFRFDVVDLGRVDASAVDVRLSRWRLAHPAPVLLRMDDDVTDAHGAVLDALLSLLPAPPVSVTHLVRGETAARGEGTVMFADDVVSFESDAHVRGRLRSELSSPDFAAIYDAAVDSGTLLATTAARFLSAASLAGLAQRENVRAVYAASGGSLRLMADRFGAPSAGPVPSLAWAVVAASETKTQRASVAGLAGLSRVAIFRLEQLFGNQVGARPAPIAQPPSPQKTTRSFRIKA